jgi:hypothetical protein
VTGPLAWAPDPDDPEERAFLDLYGAWDPMTPAELAAVLDGFEHPWWVVGGHAVEAFTGVRRGHEDLDVAIFTDTMPALREHLAGRYHLWNAHDGALRPVTDAHPEPMHPQSQLWWRRNARSPWRVDCLLDLRDGAGRWVSKRDPSYCVPLEDVTWVADDGIRYLKPEVQLLFKAKQDREKDRVDLRSTWPLLDDGQKEWLREALGRQHPGHAWLELLGG